ncbi:MAG TPA: TolC family protein [Terracidiphilus sp.]|jgi:outer membrane protein TolC|nr:TolC family protein [Terracidiphilus sp.]
MSSRLYSFLGLFLLFSMGGLTVSAQESLTLRQAINEALGQSPEAAIARAGDQEAKSAATMARAQLLPQLNFTEDISRGNDPVYAFGTRLRQRQFTQADFALNALNRPQPIGNFATRFSGSWMAFDSFKTQREIHRADLFKKSASSSAKATDQQIVFRVVGAYQSVLYAQREIDVAQHERETAAALLTSVDDHVKAGLAVESDRMSAEVNVAARKEELIAAQGDLELAWAHLREAMGSPDLKTSELKPIEPHSFPQLPLEQEMATAAKTRSDLMALGQAQSAQADAVGAAKSDFGPRVSAYGNWEEDRALFAGSDGNNWVAGVQISVDILPVGKRAQLARESAAKQKIDAQLAASQQHVRLEVSQAHSHRQTATLSLETARAAMDQSAESLRILKNRYGAGLATITDLLRAEDAERQSQSNYWHAVYGNAMAYAELLFATGTLTPDAAEDLQ